MRQYLNDNWLFAEDFFKVDASADWEFLPDMTKVRLPHTVKEVPLHYFDEGIYQMVSGYQRKFVALREWQGKHVSITFEGVAHVCEVFLNGESVGEHRCGYTAFTLDLTGGLRYGKENLLTVKVDSRESLNVPPFGYVIDYMTYGGIYRDAYFEVHNPVYVEDVYVHGEPCLEEGKVAVHGESGSAEGRGTVHGESGSAEGRVIARVTLSQPPEKKLVLRQSIRRKGQEDYELLGERELGGRGLDECELDACEGQPKQGVESGRPEVGKLELLLEFSVKDCEPWTLENPALYELKTELVELGDGFFPEKAEECHVAVFGFRKAEFRANGFYLNGEKVKLRGLNRHQSYPYVGYAMPASMQRLDADILKTELGVNAVRTSHYPQSHAFLDRCDELGLLVFTEIPGWQHIGDEAWKDQAVRNTEEMVRQYRNHPSIILWGVRINESADDDDFYRRTNEAAHRLDPYRATGGVRAHKRSRLLEDVYTYNDFLHDGEKKGCEKKANVTSDRRKAYLVSEYNGHMYPTKNFDDEEQRREHAIRHANVLDAIAAADDIAGGFGWCMFDYNTHQDFGSGDRICYHGVMDMFRNPKTAAYVYGTQQEKESVLELSSSMDIGEHPGCNRGTTWIFTNAEAVRMYKNDRFLKEYHPADSPYGHLAHGPIAVDDFIGNAIEEGENFDPKQAAEIKDALNYVACFGLSHLPVKVLFTGVKMILKNHMKPVEIVALYNKYVGDWGGKSTSYRLEAIRGGEVVRTLVKEPVKELRLEAIVSHTMLVERHTYDVAAVRLRVTDQNGNVLPFYNEPVELEAEGDIEIIGPKLISLQGGMGGTYVRSLGRAGSGTLYIQAAQTEKVSCRFTVRCLEG